MTCVSFEIAKDDIHDAVTLTIDGDSVTFGRPGTFSEKSPAIIMSFKQFDQLLHAVDNANKLADHFAQKSDAAQKPSEAR